MFRALIAFCFIAFLFAAGASTPVYSQTLTGVQSGTSESPSAKRRKALEEKERAAQKRREDMEKTDLAGIEARAKKMNACKAGAKEKKLHFLKRRRFIKECMAK